MPRMRAPRPLPPSARTTLRQAIILLSHSNLRLQATGSRSATRKSRTSIGRNRPRCPCRVFARRRAYDRQRGCEPIVDPLSTKTQRTAPSDSNVSQAAVADLSPYRGFGHTGIDRRFASCPPRVHVSCRHDDLHNHLPNVTAGRHDAATPGVCGAITAHDPRTPPVRGRRTPAGQIHGLAPEHLNRQSHATERSCAAHRAR
jgi:hypothetical protein